LYICLLQFSEKKKKVYPEERTLVKQKLVLLTIVKF